jgi:sugar phosphate isomerase/epimerase
VVTVVSAIFILLASIIYRNSIVYMEQFILKGAVIDYQQLHDRACRLQALGLPIKLELHTFGQRDILNVASRAKSLFHIRSLREQFGQCEFIVHVPYQDVNQITREWFDVAQLEASLAFAEEIDAHAVVLHRYWALSYKDAPLRMGREAASAAFFEVVCTLATRYPKIMLLVENMGFYWTLPRDGEHFLVGPLDHFFPWEVTEFRQQLSKTVHTNIVPFIDVAHATLSANMFNLLRCNYNQFRNDPRFRSITDEDLQHCDYLHPFDFVDHQMDCLHISDSWLLSPAQLQQPWQSNDSSLVRWLTSECLTVGEGNLPWQRLISQLSQHPQPTKLVMEVDPGEGDNFQNNGAQSLSVTRLQQLRSTLDNTEGE